ncbi:DME family drug/metabolite transporter [Agromyces terreus]|uniref:DME family drug/metabolite transporter n=1 Tax=Agromyces terreus TaxID=424795 RepID=A0A9X2H576_9MICO|nr:EamA family transporter [Agromyces terreus]MCP2370997.1 DME family drug/metabolite transporter [Agromyces terreus]
MRFVVAVLLASVCFGTTGTAQALGPDADPLSVGAARILIGGGALALIAGASLLVRRSRRPGDGRADAPTRPQPAARAPRHPLGSLLVVLVGALGVLAYQPAFFAGTAANGVAVGTVVALGSAPVITGALDWALRRRYPGTRWLVATVIATAGVSVLALASDSTQAAASPLGLLASLGAGASYAVYTLSAKQLLDRGFTPTGSMGALFGTAAVASLPILLATDASWLATDAGLAMALWLGLVATALAYVLFGVGLSGLAPAVVATLTLAEPLTAGLLGVVVLGETLAPASVLGLAILALGIVVLATGGCRRSNVSSRTWTSSSSPGSGSTPRRGATSSPSSKRPGTAPTP